MSCGVNVMAERPSPICHNVKVQNIKPNIVIIYSKVPLVPPGLSCGVWPWDVSSGSLGGCGLQVGTAVDWIYLSSTLQRCSVGL